MPVMALSRMLSRDAIYLPGWAMFTKGLGTAAGLLFALPRRRALMEYRAPKSISIERMYDTRDSLQLKSLIITPSIVAQSVELKSRCALDYQRVSGLGKAVTQIS